MKCPHSWATREDHQEHAATYDATARMHAPSTAMLCGLHQDSLALGYTSSQTPLAPAPRC